MRLQSLKLENFQGLKAEEFRFDGHSASIYGDNATGKTTVFNAITWLLFGKSSTGAKNFTPKTKGPNGDLHNLNHGVEATFILEDGRAITLKKVFHENYKKKRGSNTEEFTGHSIDFYIDGVPVKEKEYTSTLLAFCDNEEKMKMLTMPSYFPEEMSWDARRKILLDICGDVSDEDVINSTPELKELPAFLLMPGTKDQYYTVDEYKKIAVAKKADINKQLQSIPARIDEAQRAIPDIIGLDAKAIDKKIQELNKQKSEIEMEKAQALSGDITTMAIRKQISEANTRLAEARAAYAAKTSSLNEGTYEAINNLKLEQIETKNRLQDAKNELRQEEYYLEQLMKRREALINEYMKVQKETWDEGKEVCPTCHRLLPEEDIQKLREDFNIRKSQKLEEINQQGQKEANKDMIAEKEDKIKNLKNQIAEYEQSIENYEQQIIALQNQLQKPLPFESTPEYIQIITQIAKLRDEEKDKDKAAEDIAFRYTEKIQAIYEEIRKQEELKTRIFIAAAQNERIKELEKQEKDLSRQYEKLEQGIYLCELFIKQKVNLLTDRINNKFKNVHFRLFQEQLNGGVKEDCEVLIPTTEGNMIPYTFANNAARINAGLEIIDTLSQHWNMTMPVFIDNAESVTKLINIDTQVIRLVVSEKDKKLRLEINEPLKIQMVS